MLEFLNGDAEDDHSVDPLQLVSLRAVKEALFMCRRLYQVCEVLTAKPMICDT